MNSILNFEFWILNYSCFAHLKFKIHNPKLLSMRYAFFSQHLYEGLHDNLNIKKK